MSANGTQPTQQTTTTLPDDVIKVEDVGTREDLKHNLGTRAVKPIRPPQYPDAGAAVRDLERTSEDFSARHSARWREYCYRIRFQRDPLGIPNTWLPRLRFDSGRMGEALSWFEGRHDFERFCIPRDDGKHTLCTLMLSRAVSVPNGIDLWIRGDRFLHRMVRSIVGFSMDVARGALGREHFDRLIAGDPVDPRFWAPPDGLTLERVGYDDYTEPERQGCPPGSYERLA